MTRLRSKQDCEGQRGAALLLVLWASILVTVLLIGAQSKLRAELRLSETVWDRTLAKSAVNSALDVAAVEAVAKGANQSRSSSLILNGFSVNIEPGRQLGLVDLNLASEKELTTLFVPVTEDTSVAQALAANTADWRDADDDKRPNGAERRDYARAGGKIIGNRPFETIFELNEVLGVTEEMFKCLAPKLTVIGVATAIKTAASSNSGQRLSTASRGASAGATIPLLARASKLEGRPFNLTQDTVLRITNSQERTFDWIAVAIDPRPVQSGECVL